VEQNEFVQRQLNELECMGACGADTIMSELAKNQQAILADYELYYDRTEDEFSIEQYYRHISMSAAASGALFAQLHKLLKQTHKYRIPSYVSKDQYLYTWVDLQPDAQLKCIYSGELKDPRQTIEEDFAAIQNRFVRFRQLVVNDRFGKEEYIRQIKMIAREHKFNTEHIVPQSWFDEREPMKGDLHHLFVCEPKCNNARANFHYCEFDSRHRQSRGANDCGVYDAGRFEPKYGKGMAARSTLYFLLRYPGAIKNSFRKGIDIPLLLRWHRQFPVTEHEKHRNKAIFEIQGNRNPFIDFPELAEKIDFSASL
jgi:endonuclease I